jgi:hypothetical protein
VWRSRSLFEEHHVMRSFRSESAAALLGVAGGAQQLPGAQWAMVGGRERAAENSSD